MSLRTSNMTPPPWIFLSFLYTLYGQVSGMSSEVAIELSILVSWIGTTCGWWKSRKASNSSFLPLMLLIFMLMNFNPLIKLLLFVPQGEDLSFFSFVRGTNLFSVPKFTCSPKKESEKLKNSHFGQIHVQFCSQFHTEFLQWMSIHYGSTYHNCHTELLYDPLGQHHCKGHSQLYSLYNTKLRHQIQFLRVRCHQGLSMKRGSVFRIPHIQGVYPMPYSTFCISHIETWDVGSFRYPQPGW